MLLFYAMGLQQYCAIKRILIVIAIGFSVSLFAEPVALKTLSTTHYAQLKQLSDNKPAQLNAPVALLHSLAQLPNTPTKSYINALYLDYAEAAASENKLELAELLLNKVWLKQQSQRFKQRALNVLGKLPSRTHATLHQEKYLATLFPEEFRLATLKQFAFTNEEAMTVYKALFRARDYQMANLWRKHIRKAQAKNGHYWLLSAQLHQRLKKYAAALAAAKKAEAYLPGWQSPLLIQAELLWKLRRYDQVEKIITPLVKDPKAFDKSPDAIAALWLKLKRRHHKGLTLRQLADKEIVSKTHVPNRLRWQFGFEAYQENDFDDALAWLNAWSPKKDINKAQKQYWQIQCKLAGNSAPLADIELDKKALITQFPDTIYALLLTYYDNNAQAHPFFQEGYTLELSVSPKIKGLAENGYAKWAAEDLKQLLSTLPNDHPDRKEIAYNTAWLYHQAQESREAVRVLYKYRLGLVHPKLGVAKNLLPLYYPTPRWDVITEQADEWNTDPYFVVSIMREESWFVPEAVSKSGARGLLQLMPKTANWIAEQTGDQGFDVDHLFEPKTNIQYGTYYLGYLDNRFSGKHLWMASGYNAGPTITNKWYQKRKQLPLDLNLELIPFAETNAYAKRVLRSFAIYQSMLQKR